ncbi:hypothetical protein IH781_02055, partial [Patescibacteria group bacterium]|nr:hypothetical protein [Patescibacteria group bacterium]
MQPLSLAWLKKVKPDLLSLVAIAVVLVIPALLFSQSAYLEVAGQDNYATHWQLTDKATIGQTITPTKDILSAIGILLVPYGASNLDGEIILSLKSATGEELRRATIPAQGIKDDKYDIFNFSPLRGIANQELTIELRTTAP